MVYANNDFTTAKIMRSQRVRLDNEINDYIKYLRPYIYIYTHNYISLSII